jgi:chorismate mutase
MSHSSRESDFAQIREALAQLNSELFLTISERRILTIKIQEFKPSAGRYSHYDPERERDIFYLFSTQLKGLTIKEVLAFSLIMEDQAMAMAPGSYPAWSTYSHLLNPAREIFEMVNPLLLKIVRPEFFNRLTLSHEFGFLKDF